jgi:hypothetical protein
MNANFWCKVAQHWSIVSGAQAEEVGDVEDALNVVRKMANEQQDLIRQAEEEEDLLVLGVDDEW